MSSTYSLQDAAQRLGTTRPKLIAAMRERDLLDSNRMPRHPDRDKLYLTTRERPWYHPTHGHQFGRATRVTQAGLRWLEQKLGLERAMPEQKPDPRDVA